MLGAGWALADVACVWWRGVAWCRRRPMVGLFFILFFLLSSCFRGLVRCGRCRVCARGGTRACVAGLLPGSMPYGATVRAMAGICCWRLLHPSLFPVGFYFGCPVVVEDHAVEFVPACGSGFLQSLP